MEEIKPDMQESLIATTVPAPEEQSPVKNKKAVLTVVAGAVVLGLLVAFFAFFGMKKSEKVYRIGVLSGLSFFESSVDGFKEKMTALGYIEGKNISYEILSTDDVNPDTYVQMTEKLVANGSDLLLTFATEASISAKETTKGSVPIVFSIGGTEGNNLVDSVRQPGGNITGVHYPNVVDLSLLRLEILHQLMPKAKRVMLASFHAYPIVPGQVEALKLAAPSLGMEIVDFPIQDLGNVKAELETWSAKNKADTIDAVLHIDGPSAVVPVSYSDIADFAIAHNIPVSGMPVPKTLASKYQVIDYVLIDIVEAGRQAAVLADKILRGGVQAGTIPLPSAEIYIDLNYLATQKFGITIPENLLGRANHITR